MSTSSARRDFLKAGASAAAASVLGPFAARARAQADGRDVLDLGDDLFVLDAGGVNVVALTGAGGVVLVDGGAAEQADRLHESIAALPGGGAIHTLFNTCWHRSQTGLNEQLGRAGATIIAHENARLWLTTEVVWPWDGRKFEPLPEIARPNKGFYHQGELAAGGRRVEYGHLRACPHTDGDAYVHFSDANVVAIGEAVAADRWPQIDWRTGGWLGGVVGALELLLVLADDETRIVPARGPLLTRADVEAQHEAYDLIYERLVGLLYAGKSPEEVVAARPVADLEARFGPSDDFVRRAFQSLWGYLTPDA